MLAYLALLSLFDHEQVIKFLQEKNVAGCTERAMNWAAENGHLETVKWLSENRVEVRVR